MAGTPITEILRRFASLPGTDDQLFRQLWPEGRLRYREHDESTDACDELSARLACASLRQRRPLLIELPDGRDHRPALLFATVLLRYWWDYRCAYSTTPPPVLYFGSHVGIREQLGRTKIAGMPVDLGSLFEEEHVTSRGTVMPVASRPPATGLAGELPRVITVYAPADPAALLRTYRPRLVAVDLAASPRLDWLPELLRCASQGHIEVISWGQNPLSICATEFSGFGRVFVWPPRIDGPVGSERLVNPPRHSVSPLLIGGADSDAFSGLLRRAIRVLASVGKGASGQRLPEHALAVHWSFIRFLEALHIPLDIYEAEVQRLWGMQSLEQLQTAARRFRETCLSAYPEFAAKLEQAAAHMDQAYELVKQSDPPLWRLLSNLSISEPPEGTVRILSFPSRARYQLFTYALLARYNISSDDLRDLRIALATPAEIANIDREWAGMRRVALLVGLPGPLAIPKLLPILIQDEIQVLVYPHQLGPLTRRIAECEHKLRPKLTIVNELSQSATPDVKSAVSEPPPAFAVAEPVVLDAGTVKVRRAKRADLRVSESPAEEVARLFEPEEDSDVGVEGLVADLQASGEAGVDQVPIWSEEAVEVRFDGAWRATFAPDARINVIGMAQEPVLRPVSTLRPGERVLFIQGQQRQELYDLLVARIHRHPAFELHLALVRRWQDDLIDAFYRQQKVMTVAELLARLRERGSRLVSPLTLRFWLARHTICPDDPDDLRRLGEVLGLSFVEENYKRIAKAAQRIRGLHIGLALRLNHWLQEQVSESGGDAPSDIIDEELGLKFSDFKNSLLVLRVESVAKVPGPFLRNRLGRLERER